MLIVAFHTGQHLSQALREDRCWKYKLRTSLPRIPIVRVVILKIAARPFHAPAQLMSSGVQCLWIALEI